MDDAFEDDLFLEHVVESVKGRLNDIFPYANQFKSEDIFVKSPCLGLIPGGDGSFLERGILEYFSIVLFVSDLVSEF